MDLNIDAELSITFCIRKFFVIIKPMKKMISTIDKRRSEMIFIASFTMFFLPLSFLFAQGGDGLVPCEGSDCDICDLAVLFQNVLNFLITLSVAISGVLFAYAGILYISSPTNTANVKKAHAIFMDVVIGLFVVLGAWVVVNTLLNSLLSDGFAMPWDTIPGC